MNFGEKGNINICPIHHANINGIVTLIDDIGEQINLKSLCNLLDDHYVERADEMCKIAYKKLISRLVATATCGEFEGAGLMYAIRRGFYNVIFRKHYVAATKDYRDKLLLHLFQNETYRWTIIRALRD